MILGGGFQHCLDIILRFKSDSVSIRIKVGEIPVGKFEEEVFIDELYNGSVGLDIGENFINPFVVYEESHSNTEIYYNKFLLFLFMQPETNHYRQAATFFFMKKLASCCPTNKTLI